MVLKSLRHLQGLCIPGKRHNVKKKMKTKLLSGCLYAQISTDWNFLLLAPVMPCHFLLCLFTSFALHNQIIGTQLEGGLFCFNKRKFSAQEENWPRENAYI